MNKLATSIAILSLAACTTEGPTGSNRPGIAPDALFAANKIQPPPNPTPAWKIPLADATLAFRSDGTNGDGTYSIYSNGACDVGTVIFEGGSGDATINTTKGKCIRKFKLVYPDGSSELVQSFNNLNELETTAFVIPIGATAERRFVINPGVWTNNSRCDRLQLRSVGTEFDPRGRERQRPRPTSRCARTWHAHSKRRRSATARAHNGSAMWIRT